MVKPKRCDGGCGKVMPKQGKFCRYCRQKELEYKEYHKKYNKKYREKKKNDEQHKI